MKFIIYYKHISMGNDDEPIELIIDSAEKFYNLKYKYNTQYTYTYVEIFAYFDDDNIRLRRVVPAHRFGKSIMNLIKQAIADYHLQDLDNTEMNNEY